VTHLSELPTDTAERGAPPVKRVIFYLIYNQRGDVEDYIPYKLAALRPFADHIFVVVNGSLKPAERAKLNDVADTVFERPNVGFDVWGYKEALAQFGEERLAEYDELILMNYTWFGPVRPFEPVFERMNAADVDFWGMTNFGQIEPNPFTEEGIMYEHIQSHWIAVRASMFRSEQWRSYWREMPPIERYVDSILQHESRFTHHFAEQGFRYEVAFPEKNYPSNHPALENADLLMDDGCPVLKRRPFFHYPPFLDRHAIIGRWVAERAEHYGYPMELMWRDLVRHSEPKTLNTDASMLEILPDVEVAYDSSRPFRIAATVHIFYEDMTDDILDKLLTLPSPFDLYVTTTDEQKAAVIRQVIDDRAAERITRYEVRVLPSNRGRDLSAFFIGTRDVLLSDDYDLIVKIHSKKTVQESFNAGRFFAWQQFENLLHTPGYTANVLGLFQKEPGLGLVFPPMIHIGFPTMGRGWYANLQPTADLFKQLGIRVPLDGVSPLAPYGAMFIARPEALRILAEHEWRYRDYSPPSEHKDGSLAHVQERSIAYAAAELGYHSRTVANTEYAAISHTYLEFKLDQMGATMPGYPIEQIQFLHRAGWLGHGGIVALTRVYLKLNHPRLARALAPLNKPARKAHHLLWTLRHPLQARAAKEVADVDLREAGLRPEE
jgi:lipopolysaccharide biosynthesis protein